MTDEDFPAGLGRHIVEAAERPMDEHDEALFGQVRRLYGDVDPVPPDFVTRIQFALALDEVFAEVAHITRMPVDTLAMRSDNVTGTRTETLTFSADRLTAMVTVTRVGDRIRIDGWVAPPAPLEVRLRMQGERRIEAADESGRFVIADLPEGFAQLSFHPPATGAETALGEGEGVIVTPLFQL
jgi:hypothetical protein